jgi:hypothetical protein
MSVSWPRRFVTGSTLLITLSALPACGGGSGGDGNPTGSLDLIAFDQAGVQNVSLNQELRFTFSEPIDPQSLTSASLQVREGPQFGVTVFGTYRISGPDVYFEPKLPGLCDLSDSGFKADTQYRVTLVGHPESFSLRRDDGSAGIATGDPLKGTLNFEFHTRAEDDPLLFVDQIAATPPVVTSTTPADGTAAVQVVQGNQVVIEFSENLNPCSVDDTSVLFDEYERGDPAVFTVDPVSGRATGFTPTSDADPSDKTTWGPVLPNEVSVSPPQRIRAAIALQQSFAGTRITITPEFGQFPENALCVVQLTFAIEDFGGNALIPHVIAFTTENLTVQSGEYRVLFQGETPILKDLSTADVNTVRSPNVAQGWLLFSGDADNGGNVLIPTLPANNPPACTIPRQINDGTKDDFDVALTDVILDTGSSINACPNSTDGSTAVVWEFRTFRIRAGRTVRIMGVNPAIILVQGDVIIETGARLFLRDSLLAQPTNGGNGGTAYNVSAPGGTGFAGAGNGGASSIINGAPNEGGHGRTGFGAPPGQNILGGAGAGRGGSNALISAGFLSAGAGYGGGGGGHSQAGMDGGSAMNAKFTFKTASLPTGGAAYPLLDNRMLLPSAGSGGGAGGYGFLVNGTFAGNDGSGGGGGGGGGFVDVTSSGNINIFGLIDCSGGRGGNGGIGFFACGGGGGGGSGGGIRLLTPNNIDINGATLTTAGGAAGGSGNPTKGDAPVGPPNLGGAGGKGRLVFEDGDSLITGIGSATLVPAEGDPDNGFFRGVFDASRFQGGGLEPTAITDIFLAGPNNPSFIVPVQGDFIASIPTGADRGLNGTSCLIEARAYEILFDGSIDMGTGPTGWKTIGYFRHSGVASLPTWVPNANPGDVALPAGNTGPGITALNGREFLQLRITFFLPTSMGPFDPGPVLDDWTIRFNFDQ